MLRIHSSLCIIKLYCIETQDCCKGLFEDCQRDLAPYLGVFGVSIYSAGVRASKLGYNTSIATVANGAFIGSICVETHTEARGNGQAVTTYCPP
jgi:hypothetical protein